MTASDLLVKMGGTPEPNSRTPDELAERSCNITYTVADFPDWFINSLKDSES
jgi:hypothetical protein